MKRVWITLGLCFTSTILFALNCRNLGITITNATSYNCALSTTSLFYGSLFSGPVPQTISSGETSSTFYMLQDNIGIGVQLDYRCDDNKVVIFYSGQNHCGFSAGKVAGFPYIGSNLGLEHHETKGSYWSNIPGQITWKIY